MSSTMSNVSGSNYRSSPDTRTSPAGEPALLPPSPEEWTLSIAGAWPDADHEQADLCRVPVRVHRSGRCIASYTAAVVNP
jgi:hypothetical protein